MLQLDQSVYFLSETEKEEAISWLEANGYENVQGLTGKNYLFPALVIRGDCFFGTNTTCLAGLATKGYRAISWKKWLENRG